MYYLSPVILIAINDNKVVDFVEDRQG